MLEPLEARTLLSVLNIISGALTYNSGAGIVNNLSIATTGTGGKYTISDSGTTIALGAGAIAAGWTGTGTHTVTGPDASVSSIAADTRDDNDSVTVQSTDAPVALTFTNVPADVDTVTVGGDPSKGAQGVNGSVSVNNVNGTTILEVNDSADTKPATVSLSSSKITGLLPGTNSQGQANTIDVSKTKLTSVIYFEGKGGTTLTISSTAKAPTTTTINTGVGVGSVNVTTVQATAGQLLINAQGTDTITLGGAPQGVQNLAGAVTLDTSSGGEIATLNVDDSGDLNGQAGTVSSSTITGLAPSTINYAGASIIAMNVKGGQGGNTVTVTGLPDAIVTLGTGAGATIDPSDPAPNTVNVQNTADPANSDMLNINAQGLDTINLSSSVGVNVTASTKLLTIPVPLTIHASGPDDRVTITNSAAGSINGAVQLLGNRGSTALTVDDSFDTSARTVAITDGVITGLVPAPINYDPDDVTSLTLIGGSRFATFNINAEKHGPVSVVAGADTGSGTVEIDSAPPLNYSNAVAVNVTNAADLDLIPQNNPVVTTTGDLPTEGKSLPFLAASFTDDDPNARSGNFTAVIDWGDGSAPTPGSIASQGFVNGQPLFVVTGNHVYTEAGTFPVVVSITDLGTAAVPSIIGGIPVTVTDLGGSALKTGSVAQVNLVSDGSISAPNTDANLKDPWGIATSPTGPFWVGDNGTGLATLYDGSGEVQSLVVTIPPPSGGSPPSTPTGVAFNPDAGPPSTVFDLVSGDPDTAAVFLFATEDGTISGWNPDVPAPPPSPSTTAILKVDNSAAGAVYTGLAVADNGGSTFLYAANFHSGMVEVYNQNFASAGSFTDPNLPDGYAPYNIANIDGDLYVTFAKQDAAQHDPVAGLGNGYVDVFSPSGALLTELASNAPLDEPWGMALAPANFGQFSGDLLVANHGDGRINAFDPATGAFVGPFVDASGQPVVIDGLRGLSFGNGAMAGPANTLYFTAGPGGGAHGLLGSLTPSANTATIIEAALRASVVNVSAVEGNPFVGVVANFTDDNPRSQPGDFTAMIDWGDGSPPTAGEVIAGNGIGAFVVVVGAAGAPSHTYDDETGSPVHPQPLNISVTISETDGLASVIADGFANVADAALISATGIDPSGTAIEGLPLAALPIALGTFIDNNPLATPADFITNGVTGTALIDWGDGSTSLGTIVDTGPTPLGESFAVTGDHTYIKVGPSSIKMTVTDIGGKSTGMSANVEVIDAPLSSTAATLTGVEGFPLLNAAGTDTVTVATFTDENPFATALDFKAAIDWGDGSGGSGTIFADPTTAGLFDVVSTHRYAEAGTYPVITTIDDGAGDNGGARTIAVGAAVIADAPLMNVAPAPVGGVEGMGLAAVTLGSFTDINPSAKTSDFTVTILWGDGSALDTTSGTVATTGGASTGINPAANIAAGTGVNFKITGNHKYTEEGTFTIAVTVTDADGAAIALATTAMISDAPISAIGAPSIPGFVNVPLSATPGRSPGAPLVAVITDANQNPGGVLGDFTGGSIIVDWGDNTQSTLGDGTLSLTQFGNPPGVAVYLQGDHTYAAPGDYQIEIFIRDAGGSATVALSEAIITPGPPVPVAPPIPINAVEGQPLNDVVVASFHDNNPLDTAAVFSAQVEWGDSPTPYAATVLKTAFNDYDVISSHTYLEDTVAGGPLPVTVTIGDTTGATLVINNTANVADAPLSSTGAPSIPGVAGVQLSTTNFFPPAVAVLSDSLLDPPLADFSAQILWGDGTPLVAGTVVPLAGNTFVIRGDHTYINPGDYQIEVLMFDVGGSRTEALSEAIIAPGPPPPPTLVPVSPGLVGIEGSKLDPVVANFTDTDLDATPAEFAATIVWPDGTSTIGAISLIGGTDTETSFQVVGNHIFPEEGTYPIEITVTTLGSNPQTVTTTANIADAPLTAVPATADLPEGVADTQVVATFTDANPTAPLSDFTATIDVGNSPIVASAVSISQPAGPGTPFVVTAELEGDDSNLGNEEQDGGGFLVTIQDVGGSVATVSSQFNWFDPVLIDPGVNFKAVAGSLFQGTVATFSTTDPRATPGEFTAVVDWGDGDSSNSSIVRNPSGGFLVVGAHTYATAGTFSVSTTIRDDDGHSVSDTCSASVSAAATSAHEVTISAVGRRRFSGAVATISSPVPIAASAFSVLIDWGDGSESPGVVVANAKSSRGATFTVFGSHTYATRKRYLGSITIIQTAGASTRVRIAADPRPGQSLVGQSHEPAGLKSHTAAPSDVLHSSHPKGPLAAITATSVLHRPVVPRRIPT